MKIKVQAQHLQNGDIIGSGEKVHRLVVSSIHWPSNKVCVTLEKIEGMRSGNKRTAYWGKHTMINVERTAC